MPGFAVIGWGSLIWDLDDLAPKVTGAWQIGVGPALPLEFCRVSAKRNGALTVVIAAGHGTACPTHAIASRRAAIAEARADLAARERAPEAHIGAVCRISGQRHGSDRRVVALVADWCAASGWDGAVWTDLPSNFAAATGQPFSLAAARAYLAALPPERLADAVGYIESAPATTETPLRRALAGDPWWQDAVRRHR
ncbi:hypothetical protein LNKW23_03310 [Paralimibaculum aggregatum]|uniref:Uncharacterized protein n=1 Tax=Paralimibaculum aggregatum TaxID=3036245 RepID=A0ABQ6LKE3_9RHOB|nr:hypothetical protein [Limibaculum sp. NKW23]GMG81119.1 hypothetical protein LNKW23_03310 [Limibaculum sp. NKW23]